MRVLFALVLGVGLLIGFPTLATTLRLPEEIELLIVDGKPLGSTLLRGAGSLELEQGRHQLVLIVTKKLAETDGQHKYASPYIIVQFHSQNARQLIFQLPSLATGAERERFERQPAMALVNQNGESVGATFSRLSADRQVLIDALHQYNLNQSLAQTVPQPTAENPTAYPLGQSEHMLKFWFLQADDATREQFLLWARQQKPADTLNHQH